MSMNSIVDGMASSTLPAFKSAVQLKAPLKDAVDVVVPPKVRNGSTMGHDAAKVSAPVSVADKNPVREMSRVSESYDARGTVITKYTDSSNNVIYQTPSESVLRTQELMSKTQAATSIKA
jgi:hypothetical protein